MGSRKVTVPETRCGKNRDRLGQILQHGPLAGDDQGFRRHAGLQLNILELVPSGLAPAPERRHRSALASGVLIRRRRAYRGGRRPSGHGSPVDGPRARAPCAGWPVGRSRALRRGPGRSGRRWYGSENLASAGGALLPHHCSCNRLERDVISSCARKRGLEFRRCLWRSAVGFLGIRNARPEGSNELGGQRVPGCVVRG
jgi:hypothetical protein